ncbi:hypothetical protein JR316_0000561 [Psilocybe cubensis]|uniref:Arrestin C-terminal-like domain-containing protein n=2 Tax=Psilocybe cubensis TaxID=181762 RepID=A0A8H7Y718_PSICU|nr:hypothetical protein JR316_0000561 [Psilocybe cubensis]KAH9486496.1 hypothetical protein JR316_0000561 [Psilocybe cubensis]
MTSMSSSIPSELGMHSTSSESEMEGTKRYQITPSCPTGTAGLQLSSDRPPPREAVDLPLLPQAIGTPFVSPGSPQSAHTALTIHSNEKAWNGAEIETVLGNSKSRLRSGAKLLPHSPRQHKGVSLEKAKRRPRVDVNIFLGNDVCVEGGCLQGLVKLQIREGSKKSQPLLLSGGKIRVVGFESTTKEEQRSTFYQFCANVSDVASGLDVLYSSEPDAGGFVKAVEGAYVLPFVIELDPSQALGRPKGSMHLQSGASVRYIVMVSFRIKVLSSGKMSMAHFYRDCSVWPRLNPAIVLSPTSRPIQVTVSGDTTLGGNNKVILTASLHRLHWVAGQPCHVRFDIVNNSTRTLKHLSLGLFQTITTFRAKKVDGNDQHTANTKNLLQSTSIEKQVAQSSLDIAEWGTRGHASAKGWWMGVSAGSSQTFSHSILLPACALSIPRGKLLEVSYTLRAIISPGSFLSTNVNVSIPLEIINYLSIDPPPRIVTVQGVEPVTSEKWRKVSSEDPDAISESDSIADEGSECNSDGLGNLSENDDTEDVVDRIVSSTKISGEDMPRFADLYYSLQEGNFNKGTNGRLPMSVETLPAGADTLSGLTTQTQELPNPSSFPERVEEKMRSRKRTLCKAVHLNEQSRDGGLTIEEQLFGKPLEDSLHGIALDVSENPPTPSSSTGNPLIVLGVQNNTNSQGNAVVSSSVSTKRHVKKSGSPLSNGSRVISVNDIIDAYIQPACDKNDDSTKHVQQGSAEPTTIDSRNHQVNPNTAKLPRPFSIDKLTTSRPRSKSVKDKIRELEALAAAANGNS